MYEFVGLLGFRVRLLEINQVLESIRQAFHHQVHIFLPHDSHLILTQFFSCFHWSCLVHVVAELQKLDKDYSESLRCLVQPRNFPFPFPLSYFVIIDKVRA